MSPRPLRLLAQAAVVTAVVVPLVACSAKPENSPVIRKKLAEVDDLKDQLEETMMLVRSMSGDLTIMKDEISNLRAFTPEGDDVSAVVNRLERLEGRLSEVEVSTTTMASAPAQRSSDTRSSDSSSANSSSSTERSGSSSSSAPRLAGTSDSGSSSSSREVASADSSSSQAAPAEARSSSTSASSGASSTPRQSTSSSSGSSSAQTRPVSTGNRNQASSPPAPRGRYYRIESGDTLEKIAADNGISVADLREANRLPAGARPLPGQSLFIPASRN